MSQKNDLLMFLYTLFSVIIISSNMVSQKIIVINFLWLHELKIAAGTLFYPFSFIVMELIAEFFGHDECKRCISNGMIFSILMAVMLTSVDFMQAHEESSISQGQYHAVFGVIWKTVACSIITMNVSQRIDAGIYIFLKRVMNDKLISIRSSISTFLALTTDTALILTLMAGVGLFPPSMIHTMIIDTISFKLTFAVFSALLFSYLVKVIKAIISRKQAVNVLIKEVV